MIEDAQHVNRLGLLQCGRNQLYVMKEELAAKRNDANLLVSRNLVKGKPFQAGNNFPRAGASTRSRGWRAIPSVVCTSSTAASIP